MDDELELVRTLFSQAATPTEEDREAVLGEVLAGLGFGPAPGAGPLKKAGPSKAVGERPRRRAHRVLVVGLVAAVSVSLVAVDISRHGTTTTVHRPVRLATVSGPACPADQSLQVDLTGLLAGPSGAFLGSGQLRPLAAALEPDGGTVVLGDGGGRDFLVGLNRDCQLDASFGNGGVAAIPPGTYLRALDVTRSGQILVAGGDSKGWVVGAFASSGEADPSFAHNGWATLPGPGHGVGHGLVPGGAEAEDLAVTARGDIVVLGSDGLAPCCRTVGLEELAPDGDLVTSFGRHGRALLAPGGGAGGGGADLVSLEAGGDLLVLAQGTGAGGYRLGAFDQGGTSTWTDAREPASLSGFNRAVALLPRAGGGFLVVDGWAASKDVGYSGPVMALAVAYLANGAIDRSFGRNGLSFEVAGLPLGASLSTHGGVLVAIEQGESCRLAAVSASGAAKALLGARGSCGHASETTSGAAASAKPEFALARPLLAGETSEGTVVVGEAADGLVVGRYGLAPPPPPAPPGALVRCSGRGLTVSFDGLQAEELPFERGPMVKDLVVRQFGRTVSKVNGFSEFPAPIQAPHTSGAVCIAKMRGNPSPVVLAYLIWPTAEGSVLAVGWRRPSGAWASAYFGMQACRPQLALLGGALALVATDDRRFGWAFTDPADSASPIVVERFENGRLVDISRQFPQLIAEDARQLRARWFTKYSLAGAPLTLNGLLPAWVADECRLGASKQAWAVAEYEIFHGRYSHSYEEWPGGAASFLRLMKTDLTRWGYCPAS